LQLEWVKPNVEEIKKFLVEEKNFGESRVDSQLEKVIVILTFSFSLIFLERNAKFQKRSQ